MNEEQPVGKWSKCLCFWASIQRFFSPSKCPSFSVGPSLMSQDGFILDPPSNSRELSDWCFSSLRVTTTMSFLAGCLLATVLCVWRSFEAKLWHHKKMRSIGVPNKVWCPEVIRGRLLVNKLTFSIFYLDCCSF